MIQLIATDMDGTLLNDHKQLSIANKEALEKAIDNGIHVVLCTGRPLAGVLPFLNELSVSRPDHIHAIVDNGCAIHQNQKLTLTHWSQLTKSNILHLYEIAKNEPVQITLFDEKNYFVLEDDPSQLVINDAALVFLKPIRLSLEEALSGDYTLFQAMILGEKTDLDAFQEKYESLLSQTFSVVRSQPYIFETMPQGVTKASALQTLAQTLNIQPDNIMALGDANNDIEMLQYATVSVAMGQSDKHIQNIAKYVTSTNNQDGVAHAIEKYVFNLRN